ncbi:Cu(I)-responsive transcriptional regulator [Alkalisalibacterium limincola]|uniref:Cu(I)-responsive transcriptional regulator n=1 Tax=Alkalisalibacterium limincola TaxID=2699169 RepID=A0A5C8KWV8_9GAMM|nr:Cu(I)-responsive transcriptional regulator [Alkalisalibacterium limincola]TXK65710.1 Cu(I)-responsive transcriptional regulator [Alkalisalibacterium limincola]
MSRKPSPTLELADARQEGLYEIGAAAEASGVSVKMIRHYEQIGLIPEAMRTVANYRVYREADVHRLGFIRSARDLGFPMARIKVLLALWDDRDRASADVKALVMTHVEEIDTRIAELDRMRSTLLDLASRCHGDDRPECPILGGLSPRRAPE